MQSETPSPNWLQVTCFSFWPCSYWLHLHLPHWCILGKPEQWSSLSVVPQYTDGSLPVDREVIGESRDDWRGQSEICTVDWRHGFHFQKEGVDPGDSRVPGRERHTAASIQAASGMGHSGIGFWTNCLYRLKSLIQSMLESMEKLVSPTVGFWPGSVGTVLCLLGKN